MTDLRCANCGNVVGQQEDGELKYNHFDKDGEPICINCNYKNKNMESIITGLLMCVIVILYKLITGKDV